MTDEIINIGKICRQYSVKDVIFFYILVKNSNKLSKIISQVNETVTKKCQENGVYFASNGNSLWKHLFNDSVHLADEGTNVFAGNILDYISQSILKEFWNEVACNDRHFGDQIRGINKGSPEDSSEKKDSNLKKSKI